VGTSYGDLHLLDVTALEAGRLATDAWLGRDYRDVELSQSVPPGLARADGVAASEGRLYINNGGQQLIVGDISREPVPTVLSRLATPDRFGSFAANDGWVYLTMGWQQIVLVFNVTDPTRLIIELFLNN
jgi:hypothetical protein